MTDFFDELNAEIDAALAKAKIATDAEKARKRSNDMRLPKETRAAAASTFRELSKIVEAEQWSALATIALFTRQQCDGCGSVHYVFLQFMEKQVMTRRASTVRFVRIARPAPADILPREVLIQPHTTHMCGDCCFDHGFDLGTASYLAPEILPSAPAMTYQQSDLNCPGELVSAAS